MKKTLIILFALATISGPSWGESSAADTACLHLTQRNFRNFDAALKMYHVDHQRYPSTLQELSPNYLRKIPSGPYSSEKDWIYATSSQGKNFDLTIDPGPNLKNPPRLSSSTGLHNMDPIELSSLNYRFFLPKASRDHWAKEGPTFKSLSGLETLTFRIEGPYRKNQSGAQWVVEAVEQAKAWNGHQLDSERPIELGELTGVEIWSRLYDYRIHSFYLTDGELGWKFTYLCDDKDFSSETDAMFWTMIETRARP